MALSALLVIEDEEEVRELVVQTLKDEGVKAVIFQASNPIAALELWNQNKAQIGLVISDFYLPVQNGRDLCPMIKKDKPSIKIAVFTGDHGIKKIDGVQQIFYKPEGLLPLIDFVKKA